MNDTLIFLVLAGIAMVFKWLNRERTDPTETPPPRTPAVPVSRAPAQSEEEKIRRFMEALGAPPGSQPPPPVRPRQITPRPAVKRTTPSARKPPAKPKRSWTQPLPPLVTTPPEEVLLPQVVVAPETAAPEVVLVEPPRAVVRPQTAAPPLPAATARRSSLGELLRSPGSARQAMILREVLGAPRGLEPIGYAPR